MSNPPSTPQRSHGDGGSFTTPTSRRHSNFLSSQPDYPSSPLPYPSSTGDTPRTPFRTPGRRSDIGGSSFHIDNAASSPLQYPSTPMRGDIGSPRTPRTPFSYVRTPGNLGAGHSTPGVSTGGQHAAYPSSTGNLDSQVSDPSISVRLIWGTTININEAMGSFREFLTNFTLQQRKALANEEVREEDNLPFYPRLLNQMRTTETFNMNLDCRNLLAYRRTKKLYDQLIKYPQEIIPLMDHTLTNYFLEQFDVDLNGQQLKVRPFNLDHSVNMRDLDPQNVDQLITVKGLLIRASPIIPDMKEAFFRCLICDYTTMVGVDRGRIIEPTKCPRAQCQSENSMSLIHNRCVFADKQICRLQETPDSIPDGQTPQTVSICLYDDLVDVAKPGDRLEITGIFRGVPVRVNPRQRTIKALFRTYLDVVHIKRSDQKRLAIDRSIINNGNAVVSYDEGDEIHVVNTSEEDEIKQLSQKPDLYDILSRSLAPSIYELDDVKKGILLQLFGGTNKTFTKSGSPRYRGDINVLLVGDPGTSKSQLLQYVHKIAPRGIYTSGKGSSAVGLTAYITRDPDTKQLVLESGALVLSDGGVCCIDEFDKMSDATRSVLHEVMEQQTVSVAKAGIITTLNARTSICACANPIGSRWNKHLSVPANLDLPPPLLSRFDLLYLLLDKVDEDADRRLAQHLVALYMDDNVVTGGVNILPVEKLTKYISYARNKCNPVLGEDAARRLIDCYVELRKQGEDRSSSEKRITATTRQLESMIRMSEAHARMRLSPTVEVSDVNEASRLLREAIKDYATDPKTGRIDMDLILSGTGSHERHIKDDRVRELKTLLLAYENSSIGWTKLMNDFNEQSDVPVEAKAFEEAVETLQTQNVVKVTGDGRKRMVRRLINSDESEF
ncbi:unnamed protein product [Umbelopsis ramanniana]